MVQTCELTPRSPKMFEKDLVSMGPPGLADSMHLEKLIEEAACTLQG